MTNFLKGLILAIVVVIATSFTSETGIPVTFIQLLVLVVTLIGTALLYFGKNYVWPSTTALNIIDLHDIASSLSIAIGSAVINWAATVATGQAIIWKGLFHLIIITACSTILMEFGCESIQKK